MHLTSLRLSLALALTVGSFACSNDDDDDDTSTGDHDHDGGADDDHDHAADGGAGSGSSDDKLEADAVLEVKDYVTSELNKLIDATEALQKAAPAPDADGWNLDDDREAVLAMRKAWADARDAYERVEGSIAILFGELDVSSDQRYDAFLEEGGPDDDLFDDEGVTGMHAIERILYAGEHPAAVVAFESALDGYKVAAFPTTEAEATEFKTKLAQRLIDDCQSMYDQFEPLALASETAYNGVFGSMAEQLEKVTLAVSAEDESRYAKRTLDDMRANLEGGAAVYAAFKPWVLEAAGAELNTKIEAGFDKIDAAYAKIDGPAIPDPPESFNALDVSEDDLSSEYGKLWKLLTDETDLDNADSLLNQLAEAATDLGIELE